MKSKIATFFGIYFLFSVLFASEGFASEGNEFFTKLINHIKPLYFKRKKDIKIFLEKNIRILLTQSTEESRKIFNTTIKDYFLKQKGKDLKKDFFITLFSFINTYENSQKKKLPDQIVINFFSNLIYNMPVMQVEALFEVQKKDRSSEIVRTIFETPKYSERNISIASSIVDGLNKRSDHDQNTISRLISQYRLVWLYFFVDFVVDEMQEKKYFRNDVEITEMKKNIENMLIPQIPTESKVKIFHNKVASSLSKSTEDFFRFLLCTLTQMQIKSGMEYLGFISSFAAYSLEDSFISITEPLLDPLQHKNFTDLSSGQFSDEEKIFLSFGLALGFLKKNTPIELDYYLTILRSLDPEWNKLLQDESLKNAIEDYLEKSKRAKEGYDSIITDYKNFSSLLQAIKPKQKIEFNMASYIKIRDILVKREEQSELTPDEKEWLNEFFTLFGAENCGNILLAYINHSFNKEFPIFSNGQFNAAAEAAARIIQYVPNTYCVEQVITRADTGELCIIAIGLKDKFDTNIILIKQVLARLKELDQSLYQELSVSTVFSVEQKRVLFPELVQEQNVEQPRRQLQQPLQVVEEDIQQIPPAVVEGEGQKKSILLLKKLIRSRAVQVLLLTAGLGTLAYFVRKSKSVRIPVWFRLKTGQ